MRLLGDRCARQRDRELGICLGAREHERGAVVLAGRDHLDRTLPLLLRQLHVQRCLGDLARASLLGPADRALGRGQACFRLRCARAAHRRERESGNERP